MNVKALGIFLGTLRVGLLFQYETAGATVINRFVVDGVFSAMNPAPTLSLSMLAENAGEQRALWANSYTSIFNGQSSTQSGWLLPAFFQNLLPEGVFRDHVAALRHCDPKDHFEMLAACGKDLPGNVYARPLDLSRDELAKYITHNAEALEMTVTAEPMEDGVSLSGVQPKLAVIKAGDRYVGRTKREDTHIIAKLPVVGQPRLPELEELSLRLARAAGVSVVEAYLEPLEKLAVEHGYDLGEADALTQFLAVVRYDRTPQGRVHCEDFAQVLAVPPEQKYLGASYLDIAIAMMGFPSLGEPAVHELLRRLVVNEMLGNPDCHLKNVGVYYPDGVTPELPPAYDIVGYAAYNRRVGHAMHILPPAEVKKPRMSIVDARQSKASKPGLSPAVVREFCSRLGILEKPAVTVIKQCVAAACETWPAMIAASLLTDTQKQKLLTHFEAHPMVTSLARRKHA
jgi:serine/threonine-protein kinase HipA